VNAKVEALQARLEEPLLVTNPVNVRYLTGFQSSNAALVVDPERIRVFTDFRYAEAARSLEGAEFVQTGRSLLGDVGAAVAPGPLGFEPDHLTFDRWQTLRDAGVELVPRGGEVEALRAIKSEDEVAKIRHAAQVADRALEALAREPFVGRSEKEIAWRLQELLHAHGADGVSFDSIVGSGPNGALPHGRPTDRIVGRDELVVVDWGCVVDGWNSDCTRTFATGRLPEELARIYEVCREAQAAALERIKPGMTGPEADAIARDAIDAAGYGEHFGHGLGHGLGMAVHEAPGLRPESTDVLEVGMIVTVEPGIYLAGRGGVRIEDLCVVREDGLEALTAYRKDLVVVD
jgi:Xaa-Pro aminopeptidase